MHFLWIVIISLSVADMLSGGISAFDLFYDVGEMCNFWGHDTEYCYDKSAVLLLWFPDCSLTNMTVISLERLNATFWPFRYRTIKKSVYWVLIIAVWLTTLPFHMHYWWFLAIRIKRTIFTTLWAHSTQFVLWSFVFLTFLSLSSFSLEKSPDTTARQKGKGNWPWRCSPWLLSLAYCACLML